MILNRKSITNYENQLFKSELEKFRPHQNRLVQASHKQSALMKELTGAFNTLLQDKRVRAEQSKYESMQRQRASVVGKFKRAYQEFLDLEAGLQSAKRWYAEMKETVESLEKNVETFVNNRRSEGAQLLNQIEQERSASKSSQAELERERLRGLMERMSMEPPPAKPQPASARPVPAPLFAPGNAPRYPQTTFTGQYQVPSSPPPTQTSRPTSYISQYSQPAYNPSAHGRIPGPASPAPNVTAFGPNALRPGPASPPPTVTSYGGLNAGRPGPASPPPTQTTFSQPNQYNTYGNPQGNPSYVPPGFVPPPPPPGPPPLGPQQTYHMAAGEYYSSQPRPGSSQQLQQQQQQPQQQPHQQQQHYQQQQQQQPHGQADPWAGLNAWK